jgi:hypothetical protein
VNEAGVFMIDQGVPTTPKLDLENVPWNSP